jgi:hypothetical protein
MDLLVPLIKAADIFEGIGNEVLFTALALFVPFICIAVFILYFTSSNLIHPSNEEAVNNARHQLNVLYSNRLNHLNGSANQTVDVNSSDNQLNGNLLKKQ